MFSSMTSSMQLAQECLRQEQSDTEKEAEHAQPFEGLEMFAQTIEAGRLTAGVLNRGYVVYC